MRNVFKTIKNNSERIMYFCFAVFFLVVTVHFLWPLVKEMNNKEFTEKLSIYIKSLGSFGFIILFIFQIIQVIVAFLPGGPFEIAAGMIYGPLIGSLILIAGGIFASSVIFILCKKYGRPFILKFFKEKHLKEWSWLEDNKKLELITFIIYLIPGTPKDMLTYVLGTTEMSLKRFLFISNLGRIPALFISCGVGGSIVKGDNNLLLFYAVILVLLTIFSYLFRDRIIAFFREKRSKKGSNA